MAKMKIKFLLLTLLSFILISGIIWWNQKQPNRINREHSNTVYEEYEYITKKIVFDPPMSSQWLSRKQAEEDLDELEWLLEKRYSYLRTKGINYKAVLDTIRSKLGDRINRGDFSLQLKKFIALFGDGHSGAKPSMKWLCSGFLPFQVDKLEERIVAFNADRSGFLADSYPFLHSIDDVAINKWLEVAKLTVSNGSPQFVQLAAIRRLMYIQYLRKELGIENSELIKIKLRSADGKQYKTLEIPVAKEIPKSSPMFDKTNQILPDNIGYLRIPLFMSDKQEFLEELISTMHKFQNTDGLIIDIRGNFGGSRAPLRVLYPFFVTKDQSPRVVNIAAYRLGHRKDILDARWLYPADSKQWSSTEKAAIKKVMKTFQPEFQPPEGEFSCWHYFVLGYSYNKKYYHYDRPVIVLIDTSNYSACDIFLSAIKGMKNITLIGTPSGGGSGRRRAYRLHNSLIKINLSSMISFQTDGKLYDGNGIWPDVLAEPILTDFIGKTDSILEIAIKRLKTVNSKTMPHP